MINFPEWSDLGLGHIQEQTRMGWDWELAQCNRRHYYFDGIVFEEKVDVEHSSEEPPLMFPVGMNLVKMLCLAQSDATFGEWDEQPIQFGVRQGLTAGDPEEGAIDLANKILESSNAQSMLWEHDLDRNVYGGGVIKIVPAFNAPGHIKWMRVPRGAFFPIWDPDDPDELLEAYMVVAMTAEQAKAKYNLSFDQMGHKEVVRRIEHWTKHSYENRIEDLVLNAYSGTNPWGIIPFVYTPRLRFDNYYGDALVDDIAPVQDDLNMRVADIGEAINYNAHPTRWGINLPRDFNAENFPLGPNAMWNLGRVIGTSPKPEVGILEAENAITPAAFEYIEFIYDWSRTSVFAPPIAFGEDNGGGQRSGVTLEIRMWPLIKSTRRSRAYLAGSIKKALRISALILQQKDFEDVPKLALRSILRGDIVPRFFPLLPRDQQAIVDEVVKLLSTDPPMISDKTAQLLLGRGIGEVDRIKEMLDDEDLWEKAVPASEQGDNVSTPAQNS